MCTRAAAGYAPSLYGAYELKQGYRGAMMAGLILAVLGHLMIVGSVLFYQSLTAQPTQPTNTPPGEPGTSEGVVILRKLPPPPSLTPSGTDWYQTVVVPPELGHVVPIPDDEVIEEPVFPTTRDLEPLAAPVAIGPTAGSLGSHNPGNAPGNGGFIIETPDPPSELIIETALPVLVYSEQPVYPDLALLTEVSGWVVIKALVDENGNVRETGVFQSSGAHAGFDTAAANAAFKNRYKPAIQNGRPVATWIIYRVEFRIKR